MTRKEFQESPVPIESFIADIEHNRVGVHVPRGSHLQHFIFNLGLVGVLEVPALPERISEAIQLAAAHGIALGEYVASRDEVGGRTSYWFDPAHLPGGKGMRVSLTSWLRSASGEPVPEPVLRAAE